MELSLKGGTTGLGVDFYQKRKLGVKLPNPWDEISIQRFPPQDKVFCSKLPTRATRAGISIRLR